MPHTFAHPAAAILLRRLLGSFGVPAALVIGSMVPDVVYFIRGYVSRVQSHGLAGLFWFCLPVGLVSYGAFHALVAPLVHAIAPSRVRDRLPETWSRGALPRRGAVAVAVSVILGAATHLVWDSFTHRSSAVVRAVPMLHAPLFAWQGNTVHVFTVLQHGSTLLGLTLLAWWWNRWLRATPPRAAIAPPSTFVRRVLVAALALPPVLVGSALGWDHVDPGAGFANQLRQFLGRGFFAGGAALLVSLLVVGAVWRIAFVTRRPAA